MKSFLISVSVFLLVTAGVFFSSAYVRHTCDEILAGAAVLTPDSDLSRTAGRWERERIRFRAIVGHQESEPADTALTEMIARAAEGKAADFEAAKARFLAAVESIRACETFSFDSVF